MQDLKRSGVQFPVSPIFFSLSFLHLALTILCLSALLALMEDELYFILVFNVILTMSILFQSMDAAQVHPVNGWWGMRTYFAGYPWTYS